MARRGFRDGSIDRRDGKIYRLRYSVGGRRYCKPFTGTTAEAKAKLRELLNSADKGEHVEPHKITVAQWIDQWLDAGAPGKRRKPVSEKTRERYGELLRTHVVPVLGDRPLQQLTAGEIDKLYSDIKSRATIAPLTQHHLHTVLNAALGTALRKRMIAANPMIWIEQTPSSTHIEEADAVNNKDDHDIGEGLSETELADLISGFKKWPTLYPVVILAASTGCRRGELLALRWKDLDPDRRTIRVERALEETKNTVSGLNRRKRSEDIGPSILMMLRSRCC